MLLSFFLNCHYPKERWVSFITKKISWLQKPFWFFFIYVEEPHAICHDLSFVFTTKVRACKGAGQKWNLGITFYALGGVGECGNELTHSQMGSHFWSWSFNGLLNFQRIILRFKIVENNKIRGEIAHSIAHSKTRDHTSMWTMLGENSNSPPTLLFIPFPVPPHWKPYGITISLPPYSNMLVVLTYLNSTYVFDYLQHLSTT
jgi:hypothetical protein